LRWLKELARRFWSEEATTNDTYIGVATRFVQNRTLAILSRASSLEAVLKEGFERKSPGARL
jgi:hypothetical protein